MCARLCCLILWPVVVSVADGLATCAAAQVVRDPTDTHPAAAAHVDLQASSFGATGDGWRLRTPASGNGKFYVLLYERLPHEAGFSLAELRASNFAIDLSTAGLYVPTVHVYFAPAQSRYLVGQFGVEPASEKLTLGVDDFYCGALTGLSGDISLCLNTALCDPAAGQAVQLEQLTCSFAPPLPANLLGDADPNRIVERMVLVTASNLNAAGDYDFELRRAYAADRFDVRFDRHFSPRAPRACAPPPSPPRTRAWMIAAAWLGVAFLLGLRVGAMTCRAVSMQRQAAVH